jgi:hypothetical protein
MESKLTMWWRVLNKFVWQPKSREVGGTRICMQVLIPLKGGAKVRGVIFLESIIGLEHLGDNAFSLPPHPCDRACF